MGFVPNTELTMARMPRSTKALIDFVITLNRSRTLPEGLMMMVGLLSSSAAGCQYCTSHGVSLAHDVGVEAEKIAAIWEFETSSLFDARERSALSFAFRAVQVPAVLDASDYADLRIHFTETQICELLFLISQFGIFNRFNDAVAATVEVTPMALCKAIVSPSHWQAEKHAG